MIAGEHLFARVKFTMAEEIRSGDLVGINRNGELVKWRPGDDEATPLGSLPPGARVEGNVMIVPAYWIGGLRNMRNYASNPVTQVEAVGLLREQATSMSVEEGIRSVGPLLLEFCARRVESMTADEWRKFAEGLNP